MKLLIASIALLLASATVFADSEGKPSDPVEVENGPNNPVPVSDQSVVEWRYIGLTQYEDDGLFEYGGLIGVAAMNKACAVEFGPSARAANIEEAYFRDDGAVEERWGWLVPGGPMIGSGYLDFSGNLVFSPYDAATGNPVGLSNIDEATVIEGAYCYRYGINTSNYSGVVIADNGIIARSTCSDSKPVACSAPVIIPVQLP